MDPARGPGALSDDAFVVLDPAVEILRIDQRSRDHQEDGRAGEPHGADYSLLCHGELEIGLVVPAGEGILDFVASLAGAPVRIGDLRDEYDNSRLIDDMLSSLVARGFAHLTSREAPSADDLAQLRAAAYLRLAAVRRRVVVIDLDDPASLERGCALWSAASPGPEVVVLCARLSDHETALGELARRRHTGALRAHHIVVRAADVRCTERTRDALLRLGAAVEVDGIPWPAPAHEVPGLAELARHCIASHAIMRPDASILDPRVRDRAVEWMRSAFVSGLCLRLDPGALRDGAGAASDEFAALFSALRALEEVLGDVVVLDLPGDEVLLGNAERMPRPADLSDAARRLRLAYLRWRIPLVKATEWWQSWPQVPELEDKWVRSSDDLLPNHPELLLLRPGSVVVDVAGGLGRVARRLAPAVGRDGLIVSIELRRVLTERARRFACELGLTNLQFRPGLAERLPLADSSVDAAVNEWTGPIWVLGIGPAMVKEMTRVVRPGGRIAVTHRVLQLRLDALDQPWVQYKEIYTWVRGAFEHPELTIVAERVWGQTVPSVAGEPVSRWMEHFMPRLVTPDGGVFGADDSGSQAPVIDVYLTMIAERRRP